MSLWPPLLSAPQCVAFNGRVIPGTVISHVPPFILNYDPRNFVRPDGCLPEPVPENYHIRQILDGIDYGGKGYLGREAKELPGLAIFLGPLLGNGASETTGEEAIPLLSEFPRHSAPNYPMTETCQAVWGCPYVTQYEEVNSTASETYAAADKESSSQSLPFLDVQFLRLSRLVRVKMATNTQTPIDHIEPPEKRRRVDRVIAACDLCKKRKVKCDGEQPCAYCQRKGRANTCSFTAPKVRGVRSAGHTPSGPTPSHSNEQANALSPLRRKSHDGATAIGTSLSPITSRDEHPEDTAVPLEGRILRDAQGKVIFVGDCAPLSFLQTVRHLIASAVDPDALPAQSSRDSIIEVARPGSAGHQQSLAVSLHEVQPLVRGYTVAVSGLVDLFEHDELVKEIGSWATGTIGHPHESAAAVFYLVLAIGAQESHEAKAEAWFTYARDILLKNLVNSMNVSTVQGFALITIYMLRAFQPNGAYLYFSLAARTAYAIGLHRTEVNASFGDTIKVVRDRIWKSLRVVDQLISNLLGRPPSTSDVDCTVKYSVGEVDVDMNAQILDASVQIFMIIERLVVEVYSRKRISLRIANYVSRQLKTWASSWLELLHEATSRASLSNASPEVAVGACSTLCTYHYGIMLLTRPFLIYELYEYMGASLKDGGTQVEHEEKRKYADAALDAASSFVDTLQTVIHTGKMPRRMPLIVSWLFTTSLVLAVGVLGHSGMAFTDDCQASIRCLDYFGKVDPHARQYSLTVQSLLKTTTSHVRQREQHLRSQQKQASSQLFGLLPSAITTPRQDFAHRRRHSAVQSFTSSVSEPDNIVAPAPSDWTIYDADFFSMPWMNESDQGLQGFLQPGTHTFDGASIADIPLFPIYDQQSGGGFL
ncbi:hypothetical protein OPT61_g2760 [Boeremia exigua]|uniref:Uncharacterized protein n=1 Tax=Boeremia exigua TaxID=749465 RepID=A0ACC2IKE6_9PLEO|nr:hypothetical protein OPT61_g2760 [Boeremia exigua]